MAELFKKEMKLASSPLSFLFIAAGLLAFCPGYPILCAAFFVCLGIFQSFRFAREANDIVYSSLLPIRKGDIVRGKYLFCAFIELCGLLVSTAATFVRMMLPDVTAYRENALMNANPAYLGFSLLIYGLFNAIFVCGFFKTAYNFVKPFVKYLIATFALIIIAETLHYFPGLEAVNSFGFDNIGLQLVILAGGAVLFALLTVLSEKRAMKHFEKVDL